MVDTDVVIGALRGGHDLVALVRALSPHALTLSAIVLGELHHGLRHRRALTQKRKLQGIVDRLGCQPITERVAIRYGAVADQLMRDGKQIGVADAWIAAHALDLDCVLATNNLAHFRCIKALRCGAPVSLIEQLS